MPAVNPKLTHEPQIRDMAFIRCPNCDTIHDLDALLFNGASRKVRCATCRTVWEADDPTKETGLAVGIPALNPAELRPLPARAAKPAAGMEDAAEPAPPESSSPESPDAESAEASATISPDELEALFADTPVVAETPVPVAAESPVPQAEIMTEEIPDFDPRSLARAQDEALAAAGSSGSYGNESEAAREARRLKRLHASELHHRRDMRAGARSAAAIVLAGGLATLATLFFFRNEVVRLVPESAALYEALAIAGERRTLDIRDVASTMVREGDRETLEISGTIANTSKSLQRIPILRLSIRNAAGQDLYVWTASADQAELTPGEATSFRRRLANPPAEAHSVMVRFVAKDDIVAAIR